MRVTTCEDAMTLKDVSYLDFSHKFRRNPIESNRSLINKIVKNFPISNEACQKKPVKTAGPLFICAFAIHFTIFQRIVDIKFRIVLDI